MTQSDGPCISTWLKYEAVNQLCFFTNLILSNTPKIKLRHYLRVHKVTRYNVLAGPQSNEIP